MKTFQVLIQVTLPEGWYDEYGDFRTTDTAKGLVDGALRAHQKSLIPSFEYEIFGAVDPQQASYVALSDWKYDENYHTS